MHEIREVYITWTADKNLLELFKKIRETEAKNLLFVTGDVHFPYFMHYDPFNSKKPFCYEIGATPLSGLPLPPSKPDATLNPTLVWTTGEFLTGPMNFGYVEMTGKGHVSLKFITNDGSELYSTEISPEE